ncbi:MAG: ATP-binding protein [Candidatus Aenigmarchaeota archaeon]|nr:ATP-binding protein [Candidatus Aenigmarchaeota archaeon]
MENEEIDVNKAFDKAEKIGVIGSPSSTNRLTIDILGTAMNKKLVGTLCVFKHMQDGREHFSLGQITEIQLKNVWSEDPTMRGLIRQKGRVDPITEKQDTHTASMIVSSVFSKADSVMGQSILGTVPSTGSPIKLINNDIMKGLLVNHQNELSYLGRAYGSDILMPMWFKHFGKETGGVGEAYHIGIFGKTGSGKSVFAKMAMLGYARHPSMSMFIIDPQGEFAKEIKRDTKLKGILEKKLHREVKIYDLHNLVMTGWELFKKTLVNSEFFDKLTIWEEIKPRAAEVVVNILRAKMGGQAQLGQHTEIPPYKAFEQAAFDRVWNALSRDDIWTKIYYAKDSRERVQLQYADANKDEFFEIWKQVANLFKYEGRSGVKKIIDLVNEVVSKENEENRPITIIDLSESEIPDDILWNENISFVVIKELLDKLKSEAEKEFKKERNLNCLVVIDEAHRLAPRERKENENLEVLKATFIDAVRTTRKFGLGWMFISQTLSSLDRGIVEQLRAYVFGFGLGWGIELQALKELIGGNRDAISLYQLFNDPQSSFGEKQYPFMMVGPLSPLSFSSIPLFVTALNFPDEFLSINFSE